MKKHSVITLITLLLLFVSPMSTTVSATPAQDASSLLSLLGANLATKHSLKGKIIAVDPGHGGSDTGAIGPNNTEEKDITLAISSDLGKLLSAEGAKVIMTRTSDHDVAPEGASDIEELQARVDIANEAKADLFVSIHADASPELVTGTTTYFYPGSSDYLASLVQNSLVSQLKLYNRGFQPNDYYVLKNTNMPAILTEAAFLSNPKEEKLLLSPSFNKKVALGIYNGIQKYFSSQ